MHDRGGGVRSRKLFRAAIRWSTRAVLALLVLVIVLSLVGAVFQHVATRSDALRFRPNGRIVEVGAQKFHLHCMGQGRPTVVLEPGLGLPSLVWSWVQTEVASVARVCTYDRAGYGWSDPTDAPSDAVNTSRQLYALLGVADVAPPYVLVGHSIGGAYARMFVAQYPQTVAALVVVDGSSPAAFDRSDLPQRSPVLGAAKHYFAAIGGVRTLLPLGWVRFWRDLPPQDGAAVKAFISGTRHIDAAIKERDSLLDTLEQVRPLGDLGSLPLTVIYSERVVLPEPQDAATAAKWAAAIERQRRYWLGSSTDSRLVSIPGSDHISVVTTQEHARALARAVIETLEKVKQ